MYIYLRVTDDCNINCEHCYSIKGKNYMPEELLDKINDRFNSNHFIFHGGEPLLMPPDWLKKAFNKLKGTFSIQSNLISVNNEYVKLLEENRDKIHNSIGTSLDFYRIKYIDKIFSNVSLLNQKGFQISAVITISDVADYKDYNSLISEFLRAGGKDFKIQLITPINSDSSSNINIDFEKIKETFIYLLELKNNTLRDRLGLCSYNIPVKLFGGNCARGVRTINPDGTIYVCPEFAGQGIFQVGDVENTLKYPENIKMFYSRTSKLINECNVECFKYCEGGCVSLSYFFGNIYSKDPYCDIYFNVFKEKQVIPCLNFNSVPH